MMELDLGDILLKLIGPIRPVGDCNEDSKRFENLREYCALAEGMVREIQALTKFANGHEGSVKKAGKYAAHNIEEIKEFI